VGESVNNPASPVLRFPGSNKRPPFLLNWLITIILLLPGVSQAASQEVVVLLHGVASVPLSMKYLEKGFEEEGYTVLNLGYPSTRESIGENAAAIRAEILEYVDSLDPGTEVTVHLVAHSLGNLVARRAMSDGIPNLGRMVMIAPPNHGSFVAEAVKHLNIFFWIYGESGQQLSADNRAFFEELPEPSCSFGIIAGGKGNNEGFLPLIPGDDDGVIRVETTRLPGADDFTIIDAEHTLILFKKETLRQTVHFLRNGYFERQKD
jgi:pimeloyl-ACP methyl ester carboxylesterase